MGVLGLGKELRRFLRSKKASVEKRPGEKSGGAGPVGFVASSGGGSGSGLVGSMGSPAQKRTAKIGVHPSQKKAETGNPAEEWEFSHT